VESEFTITPDDFDKFKRVLNALRDIRDNKLYRETHETFEDYCRQRWHFSDEMIANIKEWLK
jgi:succinate dehydrogenase/fumarate reductase-like Fe-S protein